jgi:hypothetical protein
MKIQRLNPGAVITATTLLGFATAHGATLASGYSIGSGSQLLVANGGAGTVLFADVAALGGSDQDVTAGSVSPFASVLLNGGSSWSAGDTVSITGVALPLVDGPTTSGIFTFDIRQGAGGTGPSATASLASLGTATATFTTAAPPNAAGVFYVNFDAPVTFVANANSTSIVINWSSTGAIRYKKQPSGDLPQVNYGNGNLVGGDDGVRVSVAGTVTPAPDSDNDGLSDLAETGGDYAGGAGILGPYNGPADAGTFYNNPDSDGDGIKDGDEVFGDPFSGYSYTSDPTLLDSDNESIEDGDEVNGIFNTAFSQQPTNPGNRDTDNDGLGDKYEIGNGLDPRTNADFDADTFTDFDEVKLYGSDPKDFDSFPGDGTHPAPLSFTAIQDAWAVDNVDLDIPNTLGTTIVNEAGVGGSVDADFGSGVTSFVLHFANAFPAAGSAVSLTGFAWPVVAATNASGDILLEFYDPGADGVVDGIDQDTLVGTARGTLTVIGVTTIMYWNFDTPVSFTSAGTGLLVKIQSTDALRIKAQNNLASGIWVTNDGRSTFGTNQSSRVSIGGTAVATALPEILSIVRSGTATTLTWELNGAAAVDLERSTDLGITDPWSKVLTGTTATTYSETSTDPRVFFRLVGSP